MSIYDRFSRLEQGKSILPRANIMRQYQTPDGITPVMALPRPNPPQSEMTQYQQNLTPMGKRILQGLAAKRDEADAAPTTPGAGQVDLAGQPKGTDSFMSRLMTPQSQGMLGAAAAGFEASGYQDRPVSLGQVLGRMGTAGMKAYTAAEDRIGAEQKAQLENLLTQAKIQTELGKGGQAFSGTSLTAQDSNNVLTLGQKVADGTATKTEKATYNMSWQRLSQPKPETRTAPDGTVTTVTVPGMDLTGFPVPEGLQAGEKVIGEKAPTFNNDEKLAGAFTNRMIEATSTFENVTAGGYDPANIRDFAASSLPLALRASALSDSGQQYLAAKLNFITAVLRKESGAAISDTEFANEDLKYFPQPGESAATIEQKRIARKTAVESMKAQSGGAFDYMQKKMKPSEIDQLPKGSVFMQRTGGVSYYKTPDGKVLAVD
jgi:hypothetical protein